MGPMRSPCLIGLLKNEYTGLVQFINALESNVVRKKAYPRQAHAIREESLKVSAFILSRLCAGF